MLLNAGGSSCIATRAHIVNVFILYYLHLYFVFLHFMCILQSSLRAVAIRIEGVLRCHSHSPIPTLSSKLSAGPFRLCVVFGAMIESIDRKSIKS